MSSVSQMQAPMGAATSSGGSELREVLIDKARELFSLCDIETKGFMTKRCMRRLNGEIPLDLDQLEEVFDRLDRDGNGFLTLDEFTNGFGMFMGIDTRPRKMSSSQEEMLETFQESRGRIRRVSFVEEVDENEDVDKQFEEFLDRLGVHQLFKDEDYVKLMWGHLRTENPDMLTNFEEFLLKVTGNIKKTEKECTSLESALINRKQQQDEEVQKLYEEMEIQLRQEKERTLNEERKRQDRLQSELATELSNKDFILQDLMSKHSQLEQRFKQINSQDTDIRIKNAKLEKERDTLKKKLNETEAIVQKMQSYMVSLRQQSLDEKRARAQSALQATEAMVLEREQMIKQLEILRTMNKQLLDQKDEINSLLQQHQEISVVDADERRSDYFSIDADDGVSLAANASGTFPFSFRANHLNSLKNRRGSRISDYLETLGSGRKSPTSFHSAGTDADAEVQEVSLDISSFLLNGKDSRSSGRSSLTGSPTLVQKTVNYETERENVTDHCFGLYSESNVDEKAMDTHSSSLNQAARVQEPSTTASNSRLRRTLVHPERLFKVVIVGDSAVGKSSLINRFCRGHFVSSFNATIGVDFQVKSVIVEGRSVALQLWDTAGQEKFRAITQQYFRKADGVIIVYDVTSEESFKNVRAWISTLQDGTTDKVTVMIVGNKADMDTALRMVSFSTGQKLAHFLQLHGYNRRSK
ncbi:ras and EF-hand domain-containing protein-like isoform X2 [Varroa jacobsoni]|uniref:ras and EF-hand domain-containing protein-like isoform X2 n=1 Tax=Varroa jacobsoni TaxID=62625 RepID=UPI000BF8E8B3|nr:ras and EF-hand domain-containing protein-like isoform X2 [Varroa jacobsoni]